MMTSQSAPSEVKAYLRKLLLAIFVGIVLMATTATIAWNKYGKKLDQAPPLPSGTPPLSSPPRVVP
jgi:hypothetical protein